VAKDVTAFEILLVYFRYPKIENVANHYNTIEITVTGHFQVSAIKNLLNFGNPDIKIPNPSLC